MRILFVDDEPDARDLLGALLEDAGAQVTIVDSVAAALVALRHARHDILLSDLAMPTEDGFSLIEQVRALGPAHMSSIPAIALSAHSDEPTRARALQAGFQRFIGKPFSPPALLATVARLCRRRPAG